MARRVAATLRCSCGRSTLPSSCFDWATQYILCKKLTTQSSRLFQTGDAPVPGGVSGERVCHVNCVGGRVATRNGLEIITGGVDVYMGL